jgi:hypothetical protein|uniref:RING-type domain-containing protein n=1 Tax=viral metagenome TaxID=1070528 RepID=A0A6C0CBE4_9ZZZZ
MPSQTRRSSRLRSSAVKKIQKRFRSRKRLRSKASRKIQSRVRGRQTRKVINREKNTSTTVNDCPICFEPLTEHVRIALPCGHRFHAHCIRRSLTSTGGTCPKCRTVVTNINYPSEQEQERQIIPLFQLQPLIHELDYVLDLEPIQLIGHFTERARELDIIEQSIAQQRLLLPDAPEIPNIAYELAIVNEVNATDTETTLISLHDEVSYIRDNYGHYGGRPTRNDEILDDHILAIFNRISNLLEVATYDARNATRISNAIGSLALIS